MPEPLEGKLNKAQLRLLDLFQQAPDVPEAVWDHLRASVSSYLIDQLGEEAGQFTDGQGWNDEDFNRLAHTRLRTPE